MRGVKRRSNNQAPTMDSRLIMRARVSCASAFCRAMTKYDPQGIKYESRMDRLLPSKSQTMSILETQLATAVPVHKTTTEANNRTPSDGGATGASSTTEDNSIAATADVAVAVSAGAGDSATTSGCSSVPAGADADSTSPPPFNSSPSCAANSGSRSAAAGSVSSPPLLLLL